VSSKQIQRLIRSIVVMTVLLASCSVMADTSGRYGGTLTVAMGSDLTTLDWMATTSSAPRMVMQHVFECLTSFDRELQVIPQLAETWEMGEGGKIWVFHLRPGVQYHGGYGEVTAEDVVASWKRYLEVSPAAGSYSNMSAQSAVALDSYTVQFTSTEPINLPVLLAEHPPLYIMPAEIILENGVPRGPGSLSLEEYIGTGPFRITDYETGDHYTLERFDEYVPNDFEGSGLGGKRIAYLDRVIFKPIPEESARLAGLETGEYDVIMAAPIGELGRIENDPNLVPEPIYFAWLAMSFNTSKAPFDNITMRRAIQAALCEDEIMMAAGYNSEEFYDVDSSFFSTESAWHSDIGDEYYNQCNAEKAKALLEEAGYNGEPIKMISNYSYPSHYRASMVCLEQLTRIGLNIDFEVYDYTGMKALRADYDYWDISFTSKSMRFDPYRNYSTWYGPNHKYNWAGEPEIDALIEQDMSNILPFEERYALLEQIQLLLHQYVAPEIQLGKAYTLQARRARVQGFDSWYLVRAWNVWLDDS